MAASSDSESDLEKASIQFVLKYWGIRWEMINYSLGVILTLSLFIVNSKCSTYSKPNCVFDAFTGL